MRHSLSIAVSMLILSGCARAPVQPAGAPDGFPVDEPLQAHAPPPFTPAEIRDAMPVGDGPVYEVEIEIIEPQVSQRLLQRRQDMLRQVTVIP